MALRDWNTGRFRAQFMFSLVVPLFLASLFVERCHAGDSTLQEAYNQAPNNGVILALTKTYAETLTANRPITVTLAGGYTDTTYTVRSGASALKGALVIAGGTLIIDKLVITSASSGGPVIISNVSISAITATTATVSWTTDQPATSRVDFGKTTAYGSVVNSVTLTTIHSLVLTGLKPDTTYHYKVFSSTTGASAASADRTLSTPEFAIATIADIGNIAVMEFSGNYDAKKADGSLNIVPRQTIAQEYFKTHSDTYDFLAIFSTSDYAMPEPNVQGFYTPVKNDTQGINQSIFDNSAQFGSQGRLQGTIDMGNVTAFAANPYGEKLDQMLTVLNHELMHRFGARVRYKNPNGTLNTNLLGESGSHWSYLLDSQGSLMYGNGWKDNGNGTYISMAMLNSYSPLDLYLMGMISKDQVPPMFLIDNPAVDKAQRPQLGATVTGTATTITIQDIIAAEGERIPSSDIAPRQFSVGFVLLTTKGDNIGPSVNALETLRRGFAGRFSELTRGKGSIANVPASLEVTIGTPASGAIIAGPSVQVTGAVINTTGVETGVTVNGIPAAVSGSLFVANNLQLQPGENSISVTATDINGLTSTTTRNVTAQMGNYIRLTTNIDSGDAPLTLLFKIDGSFTIGTAQYNCTGPVPVTITPGASSSEFTATLTFEGTYTFSASAIGPDGQTYTSSTAVTVLSRKKMEALLQGKWEGIKARIAVLDVEGAVAYFAAPLQQDYRETFTEAGTSLSLLAGYMNPVNLDYVTDNLAKCRMMRVEQILGQPQQVEYVVYYIKENGIWKLRDF